MTKLLFLAIAIINQSHAFVTNGKLNVIASASDRSSSREIDYITNLPWKDKSKEQPALYSSVVPNETDEATSCKSSDEGVIKNTIFPKPEPITDEELKTKGLPILVEAAKHAKVGRTMCRELPENGSVSVSYRTVLRDSTKISKYITSVMTTDNRGTGDFEKPRTVAHLTEPGSEYLSSMWGVS